MSPIPRRALLAGFAAVCVLPLKARGQPHYPSQGIRLIVPYAPGGVPDTACWRSVCRIASVNRWWWRTAPAATAAWRPR
jgi:tripartite-type tricarboxylate transporter receptor subunit TctC